MRVLYFSAVLVVLDQITKFMVKGLSIPFLGIDIKGMRYGQSIDVIGNFMKLTFIENPGMAFGIDFGDSSKFFLSFFSVVASIAIIIFLYRVRNERFILRFSLALILAGALGNLIDRLFYGVLYGYAPLFYGKVVDFINVDFFDISLFGETYSRWPVFNIADASVTIGVLLLVIFHHKIKEDIAPEKVSPDASLILSTETQVEASQASSEIKNTGNNDDPTDNGKKISV